MRKRTTLKVAGVAMIVGMVAMASTETKNADASESSLFPPAGATYVNIAKSTAEARTLIESLPKRVSDYKRDLEELSVPGGMALTDASKVLARGIFGCGKDSFDPRTFGEGSYERHLKMYQDIFAKSKFSQWRIVDQTITPSNYVFSMCRKNDNARLRGKFVFWCERFFCVDGAAMHAFYVRTFPELTDCDARLESERSKLALAHWEPGIRSRMKNKRETVNRVANALALIGGSKEDFEIASNVWISIPGPEYLRLDESNALWRTAYSMTGDKFNASTLVCYFPTNQTKGSTLLASEIGLPAVRQLFEAEGKCNGRDFGTLLENLVAGIREVQRSHFRVGVTGVDEDTWQELFFSRIGCLQYSACIESKEGFRAVLSQLHFLLNGHALYLSLRKDFAKGECADVRDVAARQRRVLQRWISVIMDDPKNAKGPYALTEKERRARRAVSPTPARTETVQDEIARRKQGAVDEKFNRVVALFMLMVLILAVVYCVKRILKEKAPRTDAHVDSDAVERTARCHFCGTAIPQNHTVTVSLHGNHHLHLDGSQSWQNVEVKVPCCATCYESIRRANRRTWIKRLLTVLIVYALSTVLLTWAFSMDYWRNGIRDEIIVACIFSILSALLALVVVTGCDPMPFAPKWFKMAGKTPVIAVLLARKFRLRCSAKPSAELGVAASRVGKRETDSDKKATGLSNRSAALENGGANRIANSPGAVRPSKGESDMDFLNAGPDGVLRGVLWKRQKRVVMEAVTCRLYLPDGWNAEPEMNAISPHDCIAQFAGPNPHEWFSVEHIHLSSGHVQDDLGDWVNTSRLLFGKLNLHPHSNRSVGVARAKELLFDRLARRDTSYMKYHQADDMATFTGTLQIEECLCRLFIVILRRGDESWKFEYVFPAATGVTRESLAYRSEEIKSAVRLFVPIETFGGSRCVLCGAGVDEPPVDKPIDGLEVIMKDFTLFEGGPKIRQAGMNMLCCPECKKKLMTEGINRKMLEEILDVKEQIGKGATVSEVKCAGKAVNIQK